MDSPIEKRHVRGRIARSDMKLGQIAKRHLEVSPRRMTKQDITKEQFLTNLNKVCQPIKHKGEEQT